MYGLGDADFVWRQLDACEIRGEIVPLVGLLKAQARGQQEEGEEHHHDQHGCVHDQDQRRDEVGLRSLVDCMERCCG